MPSSSSEFSFRITVQKDGQTYIADLDYDDVLTLTTALSTANAAAHYKLNETIQYTELLCSYDHKKFHETLDKMFTVLKPIMGENLRSTRLEDL